jgi:hypothetical protein
VQKTIKLDFSESKMDLAGFAETRNFKRPFFQDSLDRLAELNAMAPEEEIEMNLASREEALNFLKTAPYRTKPHIFLEDNGNISVTWKGDRDRHLAVEFLGGAFVHFVSFIRRPDHNKVSRSVGTDSLSATQNRLRESGL